MAEQKKMKKLRCGSNREHREEKDIGPEGDRIGHAGHELVIPAGALTRTVHFVFVVPASPYLEVQIEPSVNFEKPAHLTLNYAHCKDIPKEERFIVRLGAGGEPIERLPSRDNGNRVTADLDHLTKYALATGS